MAKRLNFSVQDVRFMQRALRLAGRGLGAVEPNPLVGAVVAQGGTLISQGYHRRYGAGHAEVNALKAAGERARGATLYVTLEPCCHWGKTPPCTEAILAAGIARVVVAMIDPFAQVQGKGVALLRRHGVRVEVGLLEGSAKAMNAAFITRLAEGRPYVIAKWAQSVDGCVALASGESQWISSETSRGFVQVLRGRVDAIIVGIGTALADDPLLMARPAGEGGEGDSSDCDAGGAGFGVSFAGGVAIGADGAVRAGDGGAWEEVGGVCGTASAGVGGTRGDDGGGCCGWCGASADCGAAEVSGCAGVYECAGGGRCGGDGRVFCGGRGGC